MTNTKSEPLSLLVLLSAYPGGISALAAASGRTRQSLYNFANRASSKAPLGTIRAIADAFARSQIAKVTYEQLVRAWGAA